MKLTEMADEKHHIGDFLPPEDFKKFMNTYSVSFRDFNKNTKFLAYFY